MLSYTAWKAAALNWVQPLSITMPRRPPFASRRRHPAASLATQLAELSLAAPQVVAHRVARMAHAGPTLSARDQKEFQLMVSEKTAAFSQAWSAMAVQAAVANQALALSFFKSLWLPFGHKPSAAAAASQIQRAGTRVLSKGVAPVHRKAVANAKRLSRTKLR